MTITIATAAERISCALDMYPSEGKPLTIATTYAIQCGIDTGTQEGGQAPDVEIDGDTFVAVVSAAVEADTRAVIRRTKAIDAWRTEQAMGMTDPSTQELLELLLPELWLQRQTWLALWDEDREAHRVANPGNPMLLQVGTPFADEHLRPETVAARDAYDANLAKLAR
jgi:hypothetical protein